MIITVRETRNSFHFLLRSDFAAHKIVGGIFFALFFGLSLAISQIWIILYTVDRENRKVNSGRKEVKMFEVVKKAFRRWNRRKAERNKIRRTVKLGKITGTIR